MRSVRRCRAAPAQCWVDPAPRWVDPAPPLVAAWAELVAADLAAAKLGGPSSTTTAAASLDASFLYGCAPRWVSPAPPHLSPHALALATLLAGLHADYEQEAATLAPPSTTLGVPSTVGAEAFENARARTIAAFQHATLHEFAPALLGRTAQAAARGAPGFLDATLPRGAAAPGGPATPHCRDAWRHLAALGTRGAIAPSLPVTAGHAAAPPPMVAPGRRPPDATARAIARALLATLGQPSTATGLDGASSTAGADAKSWPGAAALDGCLWEVRRADRHWYEWHEAANASALRGTVVTTALLGVPPLTGTRSPRAGRSGGPTTDPTSSSGTAAAQDPDASAACTSESWLAVALAGIAAAALLALFFIFLAQ